MSIISLIKWIINFKKSQILSLYPIQFIRLYDAKYCPPKMCYEYKYSDVFM